jgi:peptidoglycan/LPS O-acetylase OafA/YrhL
MRTIRQTYQRGHAAEDSSYIPGLDGLRAVSVSIVIISHAGFGNVIPGGLGVTIFFFISGLLITNLLLTEWDRHGDINIANFYIRRFLRLSPELWVYVGSCVLLSLIFATPIQWEYVLGGLLYFTNYLNIFLTTSVETPFTTGHLWSLAVEEHFYLTYPLLMAVIIARPRCLMGVLLGICFLSLAVRLLAFDGPLPDNYAYFASEARLDSIAYGCLCAILGRMFPTFLPFLVRYPAITGSAGVLLLLLSLVIRSPEFRETIRYSIQGVGLILCALALYAGQASAWLLRCLEWRPFRVLGQLSYGMYLWHFMPIQAYAMVRGFELPEHMPISDKLIALMIGYAAAVSLAYPSYRFVLGPVARLRRRFGSHASGGAQLAKGRAVPSSGAA